MWKPFWYIFIFERQQCIYYPSTAHHYARSMFNQLQSQSVFIVLNLKYVPNSEYSIIIIIQFAIPKITKFHCPSSGQQVFMVGCEENVNMSNSGEKQWHTCHWYICNVNLLQVRISQISIKQLLQMHQNNTEYRYLGRSWPKTVNQNHTGFNILSSPILNMNKKLNVCLCHIFDISYPVSSRIAEVHLSG